MNRSVLRGIGLLEHLAALKRPASLKDLTRCGYAVSVQERTLYTSGVAAPIYDHRQVIGSLGILGPNDRIQAAGIEKIGLPVFFDLREFAEYPNSSLVTTRSRIERNRDEVRRFSRAWTEAIAFIKQRPGEAQTILRKYVRVDDAEILKSTYQFYAEKLPRSPRVFEKGLKSLMDATKIYNPNRKVIHFDQLVDMSFVEEMERDGFIQSLYR